MYKNIFAATTKRVSQSTNPNINVYIRNKTIQRLNLYKDCSKELLSERIKKLDYEWDIERCLETNAAIIILLSSICGLKKRRCWFLITGTISFFLLLHALMGWCPPLTILRKAGVRTSEEINNEKTVLKMMRGDFAVDSTDVKDMLHMVEK